ncbi:MAG: hypothetical protein HGA31_03015 [Candidatus Moranbacteria bacterium]|nr:hypothetical protein [Candidatus Moranbacteria bacterium]
MWWLTRRIFKADTIPALMVSLFYIVNPFTVNHIQFLMFWNVMPLFTLPVVFGLIHRYFFNPVRLATFFGIFIAVFSFSFENIPYLGLFHLALPIFIVVSSHIHANAIDIKRCIKNYLAVLASFFLFSAWWLLNLIRFQLQDVGAVYTKDFATKWASDADGNGVIGNIFTLKTLIPTDGSSFFSSFYNNIPMDVVLLVPFILIIWYYLIRSGNKENAGKRKSILVVGSVLLVFFLNKGVNRPFGDVYLWMLDNLPLFIIFKSPLEKFSVLLVFLLSVALIPIFSGIKRGWSFYAFSIYLLACSIPYLTLNFIPDFKIDDDKYVSRKYLYKESYFDAKEELNTEKLDYRYLSLPGSRNYQVTVLNHDGDRYYRGMDPLVYSINKPFIAAYSGVSPKFDPIFDNFSNDLSETALDIYGVKKIVINNDIYPSFGFRETEKPEVLSDIFSGKDEKTEFDSITVFIRENFLPHFYSVQNPIVTNESADRVLALLSNETEQKRTAVFLRMQNMGKEAELNNLQKGMEGDDKVPTMEFKKINPAKYRIRIHSARGQFPVVFSESFHDGWKMYLNSYRGFDLRSQSLDGYKILDGNSEDQADKDELAGFIEQGTVSTLGDGSIKTTDHNKWADGREVKDYTEKYTIDFISKDFQGTIQNDNLPGGRFWETWGKKPIENNRNHLMANGYANSWIVDTDTLCGGNSGSCRRNPNGTYDLEVVVEFWPQRLFYIGAGISLTSLAGCLGYLGYSGIRSYRRKRQTTKIEESHNI